MNELLFLMTTACILVTLNYIALKIRKWRFIESHEFFVAPILTGIASIILMMQPLAIGFEFDLRSMPIMMAGLSFGLPIALLSTILPTIYYFIVFDNITIYELSQSLLIPAIVSSIYHNKEYVNGIALIRQMDGLKMCLAYLGISLTLGYFFMSSHLVELIFMHIILLISVCAAMTLLITMYNHENKMWLLQRELELQANQDELTQLPNLRSFMKICTHALQKREISILMIDIDHFKIYNDRFGHLQGDQLLREIAYILRHSMGEKDYLARYGGEEFIIMCHTSSKMKLRRFGQKLCTKIANHPFSGREMQPNGHISISIGIAAARRVNDNLQELILEADSALYESKNAGRNQYQFSQSS